MPDLSLRRLTLSTSLVATILLTSTAIAAGSLAAPPSLGEIRQRVTEFYKVYEKMPKVEGQPTPAQMDEMRKLMEDAASKGLEGINLDELTPELRRALQPILQSSPAARARIAESLRTASKATDLAGFEAAVEYIDYASAAGIDSAAVEAAIDHPAAEEGFRTGKARSLLQAMSWDESIAKSRGERITSLAKALDEKAADEAFTAAPQLAKTLVGSLPRETFEPIRAKLAAEATRRAAAAKDENMKKSLERAAGRLNGAALKGELVGFPAPTLDFTWIHYGKDSSSSWKSVADLKGKVVVLDFWATWCGPCVGSFPQVAELRSQYSPNDVEMIGVTSIQGFVAHQKRDRADCKGDVEKEKKELETFLADMGVTWSVAIASQDVFNPDFGIDGIPFVAIVGRDGKVAKAGLHPMNHDEIKATIDELLKQTAAK